MATHAQARLNELDTLALNMPADEFEYFLRRYIDQCRTNLKDAGCSETYSDIYLHVTETAFRWEVMAGQGYSTQTVTKGSMLSKCVGEAIRRQEVDLKYNLIAALAPVAVDAYDPDEQAIIEAVDTRDPLGDTF